MWTVTLLATLGTCGVAMIAGAGSVGLAGEHCKHDDCGNNADQILDVAGMLGIAFIVLFVVWLRLHLKAKAEAEAMASGDIEAAVPAARVVGK
jgi:hypothetical protein